jgi:hypothetical protein
MYPYVIPFSGAALAKDPSLAPHVQYVERQIAGTGISWSQPAKILPIDPVVADAILRIERNFELMLGSLESETAHLPSRLRSLLWIFCSLRIMAELGYYIASESELRAQLYARLPALRRGAPGLVAELA